MTLDLAAETAYAEGLTTTRVSGKTVRATLAHLGGVLATGRAPAHQPDPADAQKMGGATG